MGRVALVTGAMGFVGAYAAELYRQQGWRVLALGHGRPEQRPIATAGIQYRFGDVTLDNLAAFAGTPDVIIHCAGGGSVQFSMTHPYEDYGKSVGTLLEVLEYCRRFSPGTSVVFASSAAVYGKAMEPQISEEAALRPVSAYGIHKKMAEELCQSYASHFGLKAAIVRMFSVIGPGQRKQLLWDAWHKLKKEDPLFFGSGAETRDWVHVKDAARLLMLAAAKASERCPVVNAGSGNGVTVKEVLEEWFACLGRMDQADFSKRERIGDPDRYVADISKAREWGWQPHVHWRDMVREYALWMEREFHETSRVYYDAP